MPELPEIEILHRDLEKEVVSRRIKEVEVRPGSNAMKIIPRHGRRKEFQDLLVGAKIDLVRRIGKHLLLDLDNDHVMLVDLGSSGRLQKTSASEEVVTHTHIILTFTIGGQLRLIDPQVGGEVYVAPRDEAEKLVDKLKSFSIDPFESPLAWQTFSAMLEQRSAAMKTVLADDSFIVGLGDLYSDEVLFAAGLRYDRHSNDLSSQDVRRLYRSLMETLQEAVKARGTSLDDNPFTDLAGNLGAFQLELKVFEREGESCRRCRHEIQKVKFDRVQTYYCPQCQA